eukprot:6173573-Pleurochrysis_carterae.AAC.1
MHAQNACKPVLIMLIGRTGVRLLWVHTIEAVLAQQAERTRWTRRERARAPRERRAGCKARGDHT